METNDMQDLSPKIGSLEKDPAYMESVRKFFELLDKQDEDDEDTLPDIFRKIKGTIDDDLFHELRQRDLDRYDKGFDEGAEAQKTDDIRSAIYAFENIGLSKETMLYLLDNFFFITPEEGQELIRDVKAGIHVSAICDQLKKEGKIKTMTQFSNFLKRFKKRLLSDDELAYKSRSEVIALLEKEGLEHFIE